MTKPNSEADQQPPSAIQRVVEAARRGPARLSACRPDTTALSTWLRSHLLRQGRKGQQTKVGRSLGYAVMTRCLRQRQEVHRGGERYSSTAVYALQRAAQAIDRNKKR